MWKIQYIIEEDEEVKLMEDKTGVRREISIRGFLTMAGVLVLATLLGFLFHHLGFREGNIIIVYILGVLIIAVITASRFWSILSSLLSVLMFNYLFTVPRFSFWAYGSEYPVTFAIAFLAAVIASNLAIQLRRQAEQSERMAERSRILLETNQILQKARDKEEIIEETVKQLEKLTGRSIIYCKEVPDDSAYIYLTIQKDKDTYGAVGIDKKAGKLEPFDKNLLLSILGECALALEKEEFSRKREEALAQAQNEQMRANLLRSISHDLRTPLTSISGNSGILLNNEGSLDVTKRKKLYSDIYDDSMWLISLVENLLSVTRLEEGTMNLNMQIEVVDEVIEEALKHVNRKSVEHHLRFLPSDDILLARMDSRLIVQVIINLVNNAIEYTQEGSEIFVKSEEKDNRIEISVSDNGKGITEEAKKKVFEMFYTEKNNMADSRRGMGLGLFLCQSIVQAHGGTIEVTDNKPQGTVFTFTLPAEEVEINE